MQWFFPISSQIEVNQTLMLYCDFMKYIILKHYFLFNFYSTLAFFLITNVLGGVHTFGSCSITHMKSSVGG